MNEASKEDQEDLAAFDERAIEQTITLKALLDELEAQEDIKSP